MSDKLLVGVLVVVALYTIYCIQPMNKKPKRASKASCGAPAPAPKTRGSANPDDLIPIDHSLYMADVGLADSIKDSHERFTQEIHQRSTGASAETVLSQEPDINPWVGLRRPNYNVEISAYAREIPSVYPNQVPKYTPFRL